MSEYEDYLIREATGQSPDFMEQEPVEPNDSNETGYQQGEICLDCNGRHAPGEPCDMKPPRITRADIQTTGEKIPTHEKAASLNSQQPTTAQP